MVLSLALFLLILINAWVSDDAFISFRSVDNFVNGYGLVYNTDERVQTFTNPLLVLVLIPIHFIFQKVSPDAIYFESLGFSFLLFIVFVIVVKRLIDNNFKRSLFYLLLILNVSFVDYFTSGLENALNFVLIVSMVLKIEERKWFLASLIAGILVLSRLDLMAFALPVLIFLVLNQEGLKNKTISLLAFSLPWILWLLFALIYYGSVLPNSVVAKSAFQPTIAQILENDLNYLLGTTSIHPLSFVFPVVLILLIRKANTLSKVLIISACLYILIPFTAGGDFMAGRFQTVPFLVILIAFIKSDFHFSALKVYVQLFIVLFLFYPNSYFQQALGLGKPRSFINGVADEKMFYYVKTGLPIQLATGFDFRFISSRQKLLKKREKQRQREVHIMLACGMYSYYAGPNVHVVDRIGIINPILARLPLKNDEYWRPGHPIKRIPRNYMSTIKSRQNQLIDEKISALYNDLDLVTRSKDLFTIERCKAIWRLNTGFHKIERGYE